MVQKGERNSDPKLAIKMKKKEAKYPLPIREWSEDDRPREKLLKYGEHTLSNAELLAIMIRTGAPGKSAVDIGRELLHKFKSVSASGGLFTRHTSGELILSLYYLSLATQPPSLEPRACL
jgi:hypothetical protein